MVFPQPDSPTIEKVSPCAIEKSIELTARKVDPRPDENIDLLSPELLGEPADGQGCVGHCRVSVKHRQASTRTCKIASHVPRRWPAASGHSHVAAVTEGATLINIKHKRRLPANDTQSVYLFVDIRNGGEQGLGVGMTRIGHDLVGVAGLHDLAGIHDGDAVAEPANDAEIVGTRMIAMPVSCWMVASRSRK